VCRVGLELTGLGRLDTRVYRLARDIPQVVIEPSALPLSSVARVHACLIWLGSPAEVLTPNAGTRRPTSAGPRTLPLSTASSISTSLPAAGRSRSWSRIQSRVHGPTHSASHSCRQPLVRRKNQAQRFAVRSPPHAPQAKLQDDVESPAGIWQIRASLMSQVPTTTT
jgi:hypothetical protein